MSNHPNSRDQLGHTLTMNYGPVTQQIDHLIESIEESNGLDFASTDQVNKLIHVLSRKLDLGD